MSNYILWVSGPKVMAEGSGDDIGWRISVETSSPTDLFIAKIEAERNWNDIRITQEIDLNVEVEL